MGIADLLPIDIGGKIEMWNRKNIDENINTRVCYVERNFFPIGEATGFVQDTVPFEEESTIDLFPERTIPVVVTAVRVYFKNLVGFKKTRITIVLKDVGIRIRKYSFRGKIILTLRIGILKSVLGVVQNTILIPKKEGIVEFFALRSWGGHWL